MRRLFRPRNGLQGRGALAGGALHVDRSVELALRVEPSGLEVAGEARAVEKALLEPFQGIAE